MRPWRARWIASGPAAEPVAGSSGTPAPGTNTRFFQPTALAREAVDAGVGDLRDCAEIGIECGDLLGRVELDVDVLRAEVVQLDRQPRAFDAERGEELVGPREGLPGRNRLLHPAEDDPGALALELDGHDAGSGLEPDHDLLERQAEHERGCRAPDGLRTAARSPGVKMRIRTSASSACAGSTNTVSAKAISFASACIVSRVEVARVGEDRELVPGQRRVGEDVGDDVAELAHGPTLDDRATGSRRPLSRRALRLRACW